jgi:hypothetical protein
LTIPVSARSYNIAMRGRLLLAALSTIFLTTSLWAQRGGMAGGHAGFSGHATGFSSHGPVIAGHSGAGFNRGGFIGGRRSGVAFGANGFSGSFGFRNNFFHDRFFFHNRFHHHRFFFGFFPWYYGYWGYPVYPEYYSYPGYYGDDSYADGGYSQELQREQDEINRLEDEVQRLRQERQAPAPPEPKSDIHSLTVLVFRDKHTQEVQNYAIIGQTLWILNEEKAMKIPLADLDVPATVKANDERGIDFKVPR